MVQWHDYRLLALPDKWTSSLRNFLAAKQVLNTIISIIIIIIIIIITYTGDNDENVDM
jgi:hypothetical protein